MSQNNLHGVILTTVILLLCSPCRGRNVGRKGESEIGPSPRDNYDDDGGESARIIAFAIVIVIAIAAVGAGLAIRKGYCGWSGSGNGTSGQSIVAEPIAPSGGMPSAPYPTQEQGNEGEVDIPSFEEATTGGGNSINFNCGDNDEPPPSYYDVTQSNSTSNTHTLAQVVCSPVQGGNSKPSCQFCQCHANF